MPHDARQRSTRSNSEQDDEHQHGAAHRHAVQTGAGRHADAGHGPEARGGGEALGPAPRDWMIVPAPMKPMPDTIWAAIRVGSAPMPGEGVGADDGEERRAQGHHGCACGSRPAGAAARARARRSPRGREPTARRSARSGAGWRGSSSGFTGGCGSPSARRPRHRVPALRGGASTETDPHAWRAPPAEDEAEPDRHEAYQQQDDGDAESRPRSAEPSIGAHRTRSRTVATTR